MEKKISIFNDVLGPVMRGPSSSHTAGSYYIGKLSGQILGDPLSNAVIRFDSNGSYAQVYRQQGSDLAFAAGLMGWDITDKRFSKSLAFAGSNGIDLTFTVETLSDTSHPNMVVLDLISASGKEMTIKGKSTGGGGVVITAVDNWKVNIYGHMYNYLVEGGAEVKKLLESEYLTDFSPAAEPVVCEKDGNVMIHFKSSDRLKTENRKKIEGNFKIEKWIETEPLQYVKKGKPLFKNLEGMNEFTANRKLTLGEIGMLYESALLEMDPETISEKMYSRYGVMKASVRSGLEDQRVQMKLLNPTASAVIRNEAERKLPVGGIHTVGAAYAMAAMHWANSGGIICAAPTGGSAGVIPGSLVSMDETSGLTKNQVVHALMAAGMIGLMVAYGATFAAEVAGCQVEIGAAGAMAAAAVVDIKGGTAGEALDAAAICFQNTMGSVCDLVQGMCEIPCHTRNAVAVSHSFVCADLIMGGYQNPIPLDETIDAVLSVGKMLPPELRCTARGGLAVTPSAQTLDQSGSDS